MDLLVVTTWFPNPPDNGAKLRAYNLVKELARRHRVSLLSFGEETPIAEDRIAPLTECCRSVRVVPRSAFHRGALTGRGLWSSVPRSYVQGYSPEMKAAVDQAIPDHDVAVASQVTTAIYFGEAPALPLILEEAELAVIRDQFRAARSLARVRKGLTWWKYSRFVRTLARRASFTTVVSEAERAILGEIGCDLDRVAVVPNGVGQEDLGWPRPATIAGRMIYPGALTYSANLDAVRWFARDMLPIVRRARPTAALWVTGKTDDASRAEFGPDTGVTLTGYLPDVRPAIAGSAVCVVPLRVGGGTRLKILQAMALGTPVVSTPKGAEGLDVTHGRNILIGESPAAFATHVVSLLADPGLGARLAAEARELVRARYTWAGSGAALDALVNRAGSTDKAVKR